MKVSVIIPVYNVEKYLEECLFSIEGQTLKDIEVILVNDGSTDSSPTICQRFAERNKNFVYLTKENGGLMSAWLMGVERSTGDYIGFVDSDDYIRPNMYERLFNRAIETGADIVMCGRKDITLAGEREAIDDWKEYYSESEMLEIHSRVFPSLRGGNVSSARWNKLFKREVFLANIKYCTCRSRYCEDRFIVPACLLTAKTFSYIPQALYVYRMRKTANSKTGNPKLFDAINLLVQTQTEMLKEKGIYDCYKKDLDIAQLNYLKLLFERNIFNVKDRKERKRNAKAILTKENRDLVLLYKNECVNKFGKYLYWCFKLQSLFLILSGASFLKCIGKKSKEMWFD